jgi:hypothetical protein
VRRELAEGVRGNLVGGEQKAGAEQGERAGQGKNDALLVSCGVPPGRRLHEINFVH